MGSVVGQPLFAATLTPHRSLPRNGFVLIMLLVGGLALSSGIMFFALGAWPVLVFLAADVIIIWLAFQISYRSGRAYEEILVTRDVLTIKKVSPWGRSSTLTFHPYWTTLKTAYDFDAEQVLAIKLESKGQQVDIGSFMNPDDKESFANTLGDVLAQVRRGSSL